MDSKFEIILLQFDQPDKFIWDEILSFTRQWNHTKKNKFINTEPFEMVIYFPNSDDKELKELENVLEQKHEENAWVWIKTKTHDPTKKEIEDYDFIQIIGDGYPDKFFLNESEALSPMEPCETCGTTHPHLRKQKKTLQVNEEFLNKNIYPNSKYNPKGLDIINMPNGALLVSKTVVELIKDKKFIGCTFLNVLNKEDKVSQKLFQLTADKAILLPDNLSKEGEICPACGTVLSSLREDFIVRKERVEGISFFSRDPSRIASIYVSNLLYHSLKSENIRGLTPVDGASLI